MVFASVTCVLDAASRRGTDVCVAAAKHAKAAGLGINAGHDLDLHNLPLFKTLPGLAEVSIGHALMSEALFRGLAPVVRDYLNTLR